MARAFFLLGTIVFSCAVPLLSFATGELPAFCEGEPLFITEDCLDPELSRPVIDLEEERTSPVPHHYVNGHFEGTATRFAFYFPPRDSKTYRGRFFQFTHPAIKTEEAAQENIRFAVDNGAYLVQTNMGGSDRETFIKAIVVDGADPSIIGYRANAAAAKFSRVVAARLFGEHRPFGYLTGGSGGSYQTIVSMQQTTVWDGGAPTVIPSPVSIPSNLTIRIHALRILREGKSNVFPAIVDAIEPGGSGDPYAGLDREQREALTEATELGFPLRGWFDYAAMDGGPLRMLAPNVKFLDPGYLEDYWRKDGYLGHDDPYGSVAAAVVARAMTVASVEKIPDAHPWGLAMPAARLVRFREATDQDIVGSEVRTEGGQSLSIFSEVAPGTYMVLGDSSALRPGGKVTLDNRDYLALQTYHRHQIPDLERYRRVAATHKYFPELPAEFPHMPRWDQYLDAAGKPIYPQRDMIGPAGTYSGTGSFHNGRFHGRMMSLQTMMDIDAFPADGHWFRTLVHEVGNGARYRLYYFDHAEHTYHRVKGGRQAHLVSYRGALEQLLFDLAAWVEEGAEPPAETRYTTERALVTLPPTAAARRGIQPVVHLQADGDVRADIARGESVTFRGLIQVPPAAGKVIKVEWDFIGNGDFVADELEGICAGDVEVLAEYVFTEPGTFFPVLRVTSHRDGDPKAVYGRIQNIGRARVVVSDDS